MKKFIIICLLSFVSLSSLAEEASVERQVTEENGQWIYTVNERAPTLWRVSNELYGNAKYTEEIIQWNDLKEPYKLSLGQKIILKEAPKLTATEGTVQLIVWWQEKNNEQMVKRLQATLSTTEQPETTVAAAAAATAVAEVKPEGEIAKTDITIKEQPNEKVIETQAEQKAAEAEVAAETKAAQEQPTPPPAEKSNELMNAWGIEVRGGVFGTRLNTKDTYVNNNSNGNLESQPSFTLGADLHWRMTENYGFFVQGAWAYLIWPQSKQQSLANMERNVSLFSGLAGFEWRPMENLVSRIGGGLTQKPFFSGQASFYGVQTTGVNIPQANVGVYWYFAAAEFNWYFPTNYNNIEFNNGQGFAVGVDNSFFSTGFTWRLMYEWRSQDSKYIQTTEQNLVFTLGYNFGALK